MNIFDGIYSWDGKRHGRHEPIAWFPGSYHLQIFDLGEGTDNVTYLKPVICIFAETGEGHSISAHPERFAREVSRDFSLDLERVLWVEELLGVETGFEIVTISRSGQLGDDYFYRAQRRPPSAKELQLIERARAHREEAASHG